MTESVASGTGIDPEAVEEAVRAHYAAAALVVNADGAPGASCGTDSGIGTGCYATGDLDGLPAAAAAASLGCANPVAVAELAEGEVVLDLGSGGGLDVLLSARRVGPAGKAYGLDMTDEMLDLARRNQAEAGLPNVELLKGRMEAVPLPDGCVDVVLSNCVIAHSVDKAAVFAEAFRVLRPGGRLALADVVAEHEPEAVLAADPGSWVDCVSGALTEHRYLSALGAAGFVGASVQVSHPIGDGLVSAIVQARKP